MTHAPPPHAVCLVSSGLDLLEADAPNSVLAAKCLWVVFALAVPVYLFDGLFNGGAWLAKLKDLLSPPPKAPEAKGKKAKEDDKKKKAKEMKKQR